MELKKRLVHMNRIKGTEQTLFTSEGEYHLPERKPDLEEIVLQQGEIIVDSLHSGENQAEIRGRVLFEVLYRTPGAQELDCFSGSMSFEEQIPFVGLEPQDVLKAMPGIIGYIVQPGETLWDVAKRFYTTTEQLITANHLTGGEVKTGDRLLIQKRTELLEK